MASGDLPREAAGAHHIVPLGLVFALEAAPGLKYKAALSVIPTPFRRRESSLSSSEGAQLSLRPLHLVGRETEFCGQRLAGDFRRRMRENARNSVRRPLIASLTDRNCEGFRPPGNRVGLPGLHGGARRNRTDDLFRNRVGLPGLHGGRCRDRTCDPSRVKGVLYR